MCGLVGCCVLVVTIDYVLTSIGYNCFVVLFFFFQAEDGIRDRFT